MLALELIDEELLHNKVEILTSERGVTVCGLHLEDTTGDLEDGIIES